MDIEKARREELRWLILRTLYAAQPVGTSENVIRNAIEPLMLDITAHEIRRELDYLAERGLVIVTQRDALIWMAKINDHGVDVVEYTVECHPGIARPKKYW
jgi:predicted ArsR family transcriptional regulator